MRALLASVADAFPDQSMLVVGDAMLDAYLEGSTGRLASEAPVPVVALSRRGDAPGGAANVAANARGLGARVTLLSLVGADDEGERLRAALARAGVDGDALETCAGRTTLAKQRVVADGQMLVRFDSGSTEAADDAAERALLAKLDRAWSHATVVVVSDYGYGVLTPRVIQRIGELQERSPRTLLVDAKDLGRYRRARPTAVKPNYEQAARLLGLEASLGADRRAAVLGAQSEALLALTGARMAIVTLDADGAVVLERSGVSYRAYGHPVRHARAAGAGDTFGATFALALASGATIPAAADLAAAASAFVVGVDGTAVCTAADLRRTLDTGCKLLEPSLKSVTARVATHRQQGRRIVFTNGCFDLLHAGHIGFLSQAKALGDVLIVGVNSDASVRRLKGSDRPINALADRLGVLAALGCVDHLIAFEDDDPRRLIGWIRPDVFVKGAGYRREHLPEAALVESLGGVVRLLPTVEDRSTTKIIQRIRDGTAEGLGADGTARGTVEGAVA